jgi:hypothetical protein
MSKINYIQKVHPGAKARSLIKREKGRFCQLEIVYLKLLQILPI